MDTFTITTTTKSFPAKLPYGDIKPAILGKAYELSLAFVGAVTAKGLNQRYRKKTYVPNVLSFPLTERSGEIFICPHVAKREAKKFNLTYEGYVAYLFLHGCLHLKGHDHGDTMETLERKYLKAFNIT